MLSCLPLSSSVPWDPGCCHPCHLQLSCRKTCPASDHAVQLNGTHGNLCAASIQTGIKLLVTAWYLRCCIHVTYPTLCSHACSRLSPAVVLRLFSAHLCNGCRVRAPAGQEGSLQHPQFLGGAGLLLAAQNHFLRLFPAAALEMVRCSRGRCTPSAWMGTCSSEATRLRATTNEPLG